MPLLGTLTEMLAIYYQFFFSGTVFFALIFTALRGSAIPGEDWTLLFWLGEGGRHRVYTTLLDGMVDDIEFTTGTDIKSMEERRFLLWPNKNIPQTNEAELRDSFIGAWRLKVNSLASNFNHCSSFLVALLDSSATIPPGCPDQPYIGPFPPIQHKWNPKLHLTETPSTHQVQHPCRLYTG